MRLFALLSIFVATSALAQSGSNPPPSRTLTNLTNLSVTGLVASAEGTDQVLSRGALADGWPIPIAQSRLCWKPQGSGSWTTANCGPWGAGPSPYVASHYFSVEVEIPQASVTVAAPGNWCFRAQTRDAATFVLTTGGMSGGDGGDDGGCCVTIP